MQKTKLLVTASAVCFALVGATLSERQSQSAAIIYTAGRTTTGECVQASQTMPTSCSILGTGMQCVVLATDSWGTTAWVPGYASPILGNLCLLPLKEVL
jgi:hypothetical protein